jgi:hypothetical protein
MAKVAFSKLSKIKKISPVIHNLEDYEIEIE